MHQLDQGNLKFHWLQLARLGVEILEVCKSDKILYKVIHLYSIHLYRKNDTKSGTIKRFLAGTYSDKILYLNSVSESEKTEDSKKSMFPREWSNIRVYRKFHFKVFKYKVVVYDLFLLCRKKLPFTFSCQI